MDFTHRELRVIGKRVYRLGLAPLTEDENRWMRELGKAVHG